MSKLSVTPPQWTGTPVSMEKMLEYVHRIVDDGVIGQLHYTFDTERNSPNTSAGCNFYARITYIFSGNLVTTAAFDGDVKRKTLSAGDFLVSSAAGWDKPERTFDCRALAILFFPVHIRLVLSEFRNGKVVDNPYCHSPNPPGDNLKAMIGVVNRIMEDPSNERDKRIKPLLQALLQELLVELNPAHRVYLNQQHHHVERIKSFMIYNAQLPISCSEVADALNLNRTYASGLFSKYMHMSMKEYLLQLRMEKAAALLGSGHLSVVEIAGQCGFSNASYFISCFRKYYGTTPGTFSAFGISGKDAAEPDH